MICHKSGKIKHSSRINAIIAAKRISKVAMDAYKCRDCGSWHFGNSNLPDKRSARIDELLKRHQRELDARIKEKE